ncbi:MAG TPA: fatty acyl-AMP ligase [Blastocatellia bacterium]|nr:fatty acyl-AMP ligase [Blastocatellia bacterium]
MPGNTAEPLAAIPTLVTLLRRRAQEQPTQKLYTFLRDDEEEETLTYAELDYRARQLGARLQSAGARGERVLLVYPSSLDYIIAFFGCLYAGAVAVPAYPPRQNRNLGRLQAIISDAQARFVLTTGSIFSGIQRRLSDLQDLNPIQWLITDQAEDHAADDWKDPAVTEETLAFLQYTSGSTSAPRGVMLRHRNLLHNLSIIKSAIQGSRESTFAIWLPLHHDFGMIAGILEPLYLGSSVVLISPTAFLQRPFCWLQTMSRSRARVSGAPNFAYDLCARKISPALRAELDLSHWEVALNGAEPVRAETLERFIEAFAPCGFRPQTFHPGYGLAEATLMTTGGAKDRPPVIRTFQSAALMKDRAIPVEDGEAGGRRLVGVGGSLMGQRIAIVRPDLRTECAPGEIGEIWISGPSVAKGYWQRSEETERTFGAYLDQTAEGPFLRTGDLGFMHAGELFVTGRIKDLIIIDGQNYYPQDLELTAEKSHPAIRPSCCAAFSVDRGGREELVVAAEIERQYLNSNRSEIEQAIRRAIAEEHELRVERVWLLKPGALPKTSSGKTQRYVCRADFLAASASGAS